MSEINKLSAKLSFSQELASVSRAIAVAITEAKQTGERPRRLALQGPFHPTPRFYCRFECFTFMAALAPDRPFEDASDDRTNDPVTAHCATDWRGDTTGPARSDL